MLELRPLADADVPLVETWLHREHVRRWFEVPRLGVTIEDWLTEIRRRDDEFRWLTHLVASWAGRPIGMGQFYRCEDSGEDWGALPLAGAYGIDYLIGEPDCTGRGLGGALVRALVDRVLALPGAHRIYADVDPANQPSVRTLLSLGFAHVGDGRYALDRTAPHGDGAA
ncbi:GNAT family N-acetyltransferase [Cellulosimicrobium cellulans]|uniref:GNAT family N-acetyltransferase n=1 Tax=Cellulosimicrobium cellulans TaxID=1710 RepID=UPI00130E6FD5|nr:GNAT family N-acetyltransferase [Cellulosimicrobium cellulans]